MPPLVDPVVPAGTFAGTQQPVLAGDGFVLRPLGARDAADLVTAYADPDIRRWHARALRDEAEAREFIAARAGRWDAERGAEWALEVGDAFAGRIGLGALCLEDGIASVAYWLLPSFRGQGWVTRGLSVLCAWAFGELGLHRLELEHSVLNPASCRVAGRAGFALEGTKRSQERHEDGWHDMHLHARLAGDAPAPPSRPRNEDSRSGPDSDPDREA